MKRLFLVILLGASLPVFAAQISKESLGQMLYFDTALSLNKTQSCSTCHDPANGFVDKRSNKANGIASLGDDGHSFGNRNTPMAAYAKLSPKFHFDEKKGVYIGGQFWDGRAETLADQAKGPPLNPIEMAMPDKQTLVVRLSQNPIYQESFKALYGEEIWTDSEKAYDAMADAIAAFEKTEFFTPFDSKYDRYLRDEYDLTPLEDLGRTLFFSNNNVNCSTCHVLKTEDALQEPFTDFQYHNIGVPKNTKLIALNKLAKDFVDHGLLENPQVTDKKQDGKFKTPSLRNVAVTAPYMHNGVFKDLRTVVLFYDHFNNPEHGINPETQKPWATAEVAATVDKEKLTAKALTPRKVDALLAFMKLLTDKRYEHLLDDEKQ